MSRGPGRIERAIRTLFDAHPDLAFVTDELAEHCYPGAQPIERKHQVSVLRAAWNVIDGDPDWGASRIEGMGCGYVFINHANVQSYTLGQMITRNHVIYRSEKRALRSGGDWVRAGPGMRKKLAESVYGFVPDRAQLLATLTDGGGSWVTREHIEKGVYAEVVARHVAYRDGDAETRAAIDARRAAEIQAWLSAGRAMGQAWAARRSKSYQASDVGGNETLTALADRVRTLMTQNDPDAVRSELREIADALDALRAGPSALTHIQ